MEVNAVPSIKKIGIIADTHDRLELIDEAVRALNSEGVDVVLHAGDYVSPFSVLRFRPLRAKLIGVFGNNDGDQNLLRKRFEEIGAEIHGRFAEIDVGSLKIALLHGEEEKLLRALINSNYYDAVVYGHTHRVENTRFGKTLVINPGEACGYLSGHATIAILNIEEMRAEIISLKSTSS
ncbi:MAG: metallophosphoesterase [Candidatus Bathyarchaeota archaeon]|nr:metallophosphoesterase [Candidatus Bathyarchaeota archaeon]